MPPNETLACISNSTTIITTDPQYTRAIDRVFHAEHVIEKIEEIEKKYADRQAINQKTLQKLSNFISASHTPLKEDIFKTYKIPKEELVLKVRCPKCQSYDVVYKLGFLHCRSCYHRSIDAHEGVIRDYLLLISPTITNKQCSELLGIESRFTIYRIQSKMNLSSSGAGKGRKYFLPKED